MSTETPRVLGYGRTSPGTNDEGTSLPGQRQDVEQLCEDQGFELVGWYEDEDVSGRKTKPHEREGFNELIAHVRQDDEIEAIVVRRKDRISREASVQMSIDIILEMHMGRALDIWLAQDGVRLGDEEEEGDMDPVERITHEITDMIRMYMKELEAAQSAMNTKRRLESKKRDGEPVGHNHRGLITNKLAYGENEAKHYVPDFEITDRQLENWREEYPNKEWEEEFWDVIKVLLTFEFSDTDPYENYVKPTAGGVGRRMGWDGERGTSATKAVRNVWDARDLYYEVVDREDLEDEVTNRFGDLAPDESEINDLISGSAEHAVAVD